MKKLLVASFLFVALTGNSTAALADEGPLWQKFVDSAQKAYDAGKYSKAARAWMKVVDMLHQAAQNSADTIMLAGCLKHLGDCHRLRERWQEAGVCYQDSLNAYGKLLPDSPDAVSGIADLGTCYKTIVVDNLEEHAAKMLKRAGAVNLASFKKGDGDHFELALADTFTHVVNEDKVEQVRFNKRICFDFNQTPEGRLNVSKIKGVEVKSQIWVEPKSTILYLDEKGETTAEVTVDALGFLKTVTVNPPRQIYDYIVELVKQVNSGNVVAKNSTTPQETISSASSPVEAVTSSATSANAVAAPVGEPKVESENELNSGKETESVSK